jgi:prepilin-type N-terminal cleavage/methylation domain-containing protein
MTESSLSDRDFRLGQSEEHGFSMIEMMVAIVVILIGLVSIVAISVYVSRANVTSNNLSVLATAAQSQIDLLRQAQWTATTEDPVITVGGSLSSNVANHSTTLSNTPAGDLIIRWQVTQGPTADIRYVTVNVIQVNAPPIMSSGLTVTTILYRG